MQHYIVLLTIIGFAAFAMAWMPAITKRTGISYPIIFVLAGVIIYLLFPDQLPVALPQVHPTATLHLTEMAVIISLMGTGIKIDRPFTFKNWASPIKLASIAMILCIAGAAFAGYTLLGFDLPGAILLGAVLAPTDPVLASDVQVGPPNAGQKSETRFSLTAEGGLNDGMAFPFTWLAITLVLISQGSDTSLLNWFAIDVLYKIIAGLLIGFILGKVSGYLLFTWVKKFKFLETQDGFLALSLTLIVYGLTELAHGYGFVAVFIAAVTLRHYEKTHDLHDHLHTFTDQTERLLIAVILLLFGGSLVSGILDSLSPQIVVFSLLFLFIIRPVAAFACLFKGKFHLKEKLAISFFGIRGLGSIFYLVFAVKEAEFLHEEEIWSAVAFTILISVVIHGLTASPVMKHLQVKLPKEKIPE